MSKVNKIVLPSTLIDDLTRGQTSIKVDTLTRHVREYQTQLKETKKELEDLQLCKKAVNADIREIKKGIDNGETLESLKEEKEVILLDISFIEDDIKELTSKLQKEEEELKNITRENKYESYSWVVENLKHFGDSLCPKEMLKNYTLPQILAALEKLVGEKISYKYCKEVSSNGAIKKEYIVRGTSEAFAEDEKELQKVSLFFQKEGIPVVSDYEVDGVLF